jgi:hypothetical protein
MKNNRKIKPMYYVLAIILALAIVVSFFLLKPVEKTEFNLNEGFELTLSKDTISIKNTDLKIQLVSIRDSRCPTSVTCIFEGEASVTFNVLKADTILGKFVRSTRNGDTNLFLNGYNIDIISVEPYPEKTGKIPLSNYKVKMVVSKA